jgi:PKD repeat protein
MTHTKRRTGAALALTTALLGWACSDLSVEGGGTLSLVLTASDSSTAVGTEIQFNYDVRGTFLNGVILDYGDASSLDSIPTSGAQSARGRFLHTYDTPGEYQVTGTVEDAQQGSLSKHLTIEVSPVTPAPGG